MLRQKSPALERQGLNEIPNRFHQHRLVGLRVQALRSRVAKQHHVNQRLEGIFVHSVELHRLVWPSAEAQHGAACGLYFIRNESRPLPGKRTTLVIQGHPKIQRDLGGVAPIQQPPGITSQDFGAQLCHQFYATAGVAPMHVLPEATQVQRLAAQRRSRDVDLSGVQRMRASSNP